MLRVALVTGGMGGLGEARALSVHPLSNEVLVTSPKSRAWNLTGQAAVCPHGSGFAPDCPVKVACRKRSPAGRSL